MPNGRRMIIAFPRCHTPQRSRPEVLEAPVPVLAARSFVGGYAAMKQLCERR
jgi:hypothetical protein